MKDLAASVLARLKNQAKESGLSYQMCLQLFCQEEFLRRISLSKYSSDFILYDTHHTRKALIDLFKILDTKPEERGRFLESELDQFPYVNGSLFANENIEVPPFTDEMRNLLLHKASGNFNWSEISPTIFGAVFESTLNPETRRSGGMHYTSIENIHKVIDPLFLDDLKKELTEICAIGVVKTKEKKLREFQARLGSLEFLDPACGSGNFLTETYLSLRRLENLALLELFNGQVAFSDMSDYSPIQVSISQFYGIEINDFAITVAKTALWIAESQMMKETETIIMIPLDFLPLKTNACIFEANALLLDWEDVVPKCKLNYIIGNPPFVGKKEQTKEQKNELIETYGTGISGIGNMDYVTGWYVKAAEYMQTTNICAAFVSTNSITQGEQPSVLWKKLAQYSATITFAYRTFEWTSEANEKAHVHCVIIGFTTSSIQKKPRIYIGSRYVEATSVNPYLIDAPTVIITSRSSPISNAPPCATAQCP